MDKAKHRLCLSKPRHLFATGFGSGFFPVIPGTIGSLVAIPPWLILIQLPWPLYALLVLCSIFLGIYLCHQTAKDMQEHDHGSIVWDEFVGMWIALMALPVIDWKWLLVGLVIFRILDIGKPWPICWLNSNIHGGIGIMFDDIVAGMLSATIIYLIVHHCIT